MMTKGLQNILVITVLAVLCFTQVDQLNAQDSRKPNVLFIAVDDLKPMIGAYGVDKIHTPNMDKLASQGVTFLNNHTQEAVCGPSRASLLTGLRPDQTKVWRLHVKIRDHNPDVVTLPQYFKQNGYTTAGVGKVFDRSTVYEGYDQQSWSLPFNSGMPEYPKEYGEPFKHYQSGETKARAQHFMEMAEEKGIEKWRKQRSYALNRIKPSTEMLEVPDEAYIDGLHAVRGKELLDQLSGGNNPFFLAVGFKKPHLPFAAPKKYWDLYDRDDIELSPWRKKSRNGPKIAYHNFGELRSYSDIRPALDENGKLHKAKQKELIHGYMAAVSYIDAQVGKLMAKLDELGLREDTIVVLWGDHGWHLGDHGLWCKHSNFEQATRSPLIISAPETKKALTVDTPTEFVDVYPTLTDMAGLDTPDHLAGTSLVPLLKGKTERVKDFAMSQYHRWNDVMGYALRTDRYRYVEWHGNGYRSFKDYKEENIVGRELYDYKKDPNETLNLVNSSDYKETTEKLGSKMEKFLKERSKQ